MPDQILLPVLHDWVDELLAQARATQDFQQKHVYLARATFLRALMEKPAA